MTRPEVAVGLAEPAANEVVEARLDGVRTAPDRVVAVARVETRARPAELTESPAAPQAASDSTATSANTVAPGRPTWRRPADRSAPLSRFLTTSPCTTTTLGARPARIVSWVD